MDRTSLAGFKNGRQYPVIYSEFYVPTIVHRVVVQHSLKLRICRGTTASGIFVQMGGLVLILNRTWLRATHFSLNSN